MTHGQKVELLQDARATLFPIEWEEPFGLVMIESMACGTPVIATRHGAVPEVIDDGRSGIIVDNFREMAAALDRADELDPNECRAYVEERFAPERMVRGLRERLHGRLVPVTLEPRYDCQNGRPLVVRSIADLLLESARRPRRTPPRPSPGGRAGPRGGAAAKAAQVVARLVDDAEVDQREALRRPQLEFVDRPLPGLEVDLRRRRDGQDVAVGQDPDARGVARVEGAFAVEVADVMRSVARRWEALEAEHARADDVHVLLRHRRQLAPERSKSSP